MSYTCFFIKGTSISCCFLNNINRYTEENKYTIEAKITENDNNYNSYVDEIKSLNEDKLLYQKE